MKVRVRVCASLLLLLLLLLLLSSSVVIQLLEKTIEGLPRYLSFVFGLRFGTHVLCGYGDSFAGSDLPLPLLA